MRIGSTPPATHETHTTEPSSVGVESLRQLGLDVQMNAGESSMVKHVGAAEIVSNVDVNGLVHISKTPIEQFEESKIGASGKFGEGAYFAAGNLTGETYDLLSTPGNVAHSASLARASVLFVDRGMVHGLEADLKDRAGIPPSRLKSTVRNADVTGLSEKAGLGVDAIVIFMNNERTAAEVIVLPSATSQISVTDRKAL